MPRTTTTSDAFNAIAEPRRRQLINLLARGKPCAVNDLVRASRLPQPTVSKHLRVLRAVHLVRVHQHGRERLYSLNPERLRPIHDWINSFERFWTDHLDAIKLAAERKARERASSESQAPSPAAPESPGPTRKKP